MTTAREQLVSQARAYLDACQRDYEAAQVRFDRARSILEHISTHGPAATCPTPELNETAGPANRFAARVDALLMTCYLEENDGKEPAL